MSVDIARHEKRAADVLPKARLLVGEGGRNDVQEFLTRKNVHVGLS